MAVQKKPWFKWLRQRQVERTRRESIAMLSQDHAEYRGLIDDQNDSKAGEVMLDAVVEDAILVENNRGKAERMVQDMVDSLIKTSEMNSKNDAAVMRLRLYSAGLSALFLILASIMLYLYSEGHAYKTCESSVLAQSTTWLASLGFAGVMLGYAMNILGNFDRSSKNKALMKILDDARTILKLLQLEEDPATAADISEGTDVDEFEDFSLAPGEWSEPSGTDFPVRGATYMKDSKKVASPKAQFKLLATELIESPENIQNIAAHPKNRVAKAKAKGDDTFWFVFNFMIPGPPNLSFVAYWEVDLAKVNADTPFGRIAKPFFFGNSDKYRDSRLKVFPKVTDGNFAVKMAIKNTPAIMGQKLDHIYHRGDNYFEVDVDISRRPVARNLTGMCVGYAKTMVLQMALILQGEDEKELPEVVMGTVSASYVDILNAKEMV